MMRHHVLVILICLPACGHEELDFAPKQGAAGAPLGGWTGAAGDQTTACLDPRSCSESGAPWDSYAMDFGFGNGGAAGGTGGNGGAFGGTGASSGEVTDIPPELRFQNDPAGYPAVPGTEPAWCEQGQSFSEVCGNDVDEDCDGVVDEFAGIGRPCANGCGWGIYVCDAVTNSLLCQGCMIELPLPCGDGFVGAGEQCDPAAPGERAGVTCTASCERPSFVRCVDGAGVHPEFCKDEIEVCNERIGACVPLIGPRQPRCPEIPREGGSGPDDTYPMLEVQIGQDPIWECWISCTDGAQCPSTLSECYMAFCAVSF